MAENGSSGGGWVVMGRMGSIEYNGRKSKISDSFGGGGRRKRGTERKRERD